MSSQRRLRCKRFTGKQRFIDQLEAQAASGRLMVRGRSESFRGSHLTLYRCPFCKGYYFGHTPWHMRRLLV